MVMRCASVTRSALALISLLVLAACGTGPSPGEASLPNDDLAAQQSGEIRINEIRIDQPSTDVDEYFELSGPPSSSLDGLTYLVIGDGVGGSGVVEAVVDLTGHAIPSGGHFVVAESSFTLATADLVTDLNFENSDNVTHLLVRGFTGSDGADLDVDDDGTLDATPWTEVVDAVALLEQVGAGDLTYATTSVGPDGSFVPGHVFRCGDAFLVGAFGDFADDTPGAANDCDGAPVPAIGQCGDPATRIHEVQGAGLVSPLASQSVVIEGVVVGDFQVGDGDAFGTNLEGFFVQEEDADADGDPATSEGVFVHAPGSADVEVGDVVRVEGNVSEFFDMTRVDNATLLACGTAAAMPSAASIAFPLSSEDDLEAFEGMYVTFPQTLFISEFFNFDRFGEIVLAYPIDPVAAPDRRHFQPTSYEEPGPAAQAELDEILLNRITLDDGRTNQNPDPARHPNGAVFDLANRFRGGDTITDLTGVLDYSFGAYKIQPTEGADYVASNPRPTAPEAVGGNVTVASLNVLNYFATLDLGPDVCGPLGDQECRGADDADEFTRQRDKIFAALAGLDADIVGLVEIENDAGDAAVLDLVDGLNDHLRADVYAAIETGPIGPDAIRVALIYKTASVTPVGDSAVLDTPEFLDPTGTGDDKNRAALAQTFAPPTGDAVTVVVNHLKSKGSTCGSGDDDPPWGSCNLTRTLAAQELLDWIATDPTDSADPDVLLIGDYNAYDKEDPIDVLLAGGYSDLLYDEVGEDAYTYVFDGQLGYLDYAFANGILADRVTGATAWAINADEPDILDYDTSFKLPAQAALYESNAFRSSDHDPVLVGLDLTNLAPICTNAEAATGRLWPANHQLVSGSIAGVTDPDGDAVTIEIDSIYQDEPVNADDDGNTMPDAFLGLGNDFEIRAERDGEGNGRVYHVTFTASDATASCVGTVQIAVNLNQGRNGAAVDDGPLYDATSY